MNKKFIFIPALVIGFICFYIFQGNADKIAVHKANSYYKKNDIENAQKYYEKAFNLGYKNPKDRDIYVNSIINSPLTLKSQQRLIKFIEYPVKDSANLKAQIFLYNLRREINNMYSDNYISQAPYDHKILRWSDMPIKYGFVKSNQNNYKLEEEIENAFLEWEKATKKQITFYKDNKNPDIKIIFEEADINVSQNEKYVIAYTYPVINNGQLKNMNITFYTKDASGKSFTNNQIYNTALHEIAHALGFMGHSSDKNNIMYISKESDSFVEDKKESLTTADINSMKLLYNIKPDISSSKALTGKYLSSVVLGDKEEIVIAKTREAKSYIKKAPNLPSGYIDLAENYVIQKEYQMALKCLQKALDVAENEDIQAIIYYNKAIVYYNMNQPKLALENIELSSQIETTEELKYLRAEINKKLGHTDKAINEYAELIRNNPKDINYAIALTNLYIQEKRYIKARQVLKNYIKNNPNDRNNEIFKSYGLLIRAFL